MCLAARTARRDTMAPRQIVILRHAEKPDDPREPDLSPEGDARAQMLASLIPRRFPNPDWLFCAARSRHSNRPYDTLAPLAQVLRMALHERYADDGYAELAADLLQKPKYADKLIVICWHHGHILDLAECLGGKCSDLPPSSNWPKTWPDDVFGWVLQIYYTEDGSLHHMETQAISQKLMYDDTIKPVYRE